MEPPDAAVPALSAGLPVLRTGHPDGRTQRLGARDADERRGMASGDPGMTTKTTSDHYGHRSHKDAAGSGDWHCSIHHQSDCHCDIVWPEAKSSTVHPPLDLSYLGGDDPEQDRYA